MTVVGPADAQRTRRVTQREPAAAQHDMHRGRLFRKYMLLIMSLVSLALLVSGGISIYFTYRETTAALASLQQEKAVGAASRIEQYLHQVTQQLQYAALPQLGAGDLPRLAPLEARAVPDLGRVGQGAGEGSNGDGLVPDRLPAQRARRPDRLPLV